MSEQPEHHSTARWKTGAEHRYRLALLVTGMVMGCAYLLTSTVLSGWSEDGTRIDTAGRQRALAQRAALLVNAAETTRGAELRRDLVADLVATTDELERAHAALSAQLGDSGGRDPAAGSIAALYFGPDGVDDLLRAYIADLRTYAQSEARAAAISAERQALVERITRVASGALDDPTSLLFRQNRIVNAYDIALRSKVSGFRWLALLLLIGGLVVLIGELLLIFRPMLRQTESQMVRLERQRRQGTDYAARLGLYFLTPMRTIAQHLDNAAEQCRNRDRDAVARSLEAVRDRIDKLQRHVEDMIDLARDDDSKKTCEAVLLPRLLDEAVETQVALHPSAQVNVHVECDCESAQRHPVRIHAREVRRCLEHLVRNAIQHRSPNETVPMVEVRAERNDDGYRIAVRDNGVGVPVALRDRVFEVHRRGDRLHGIGLSMVRETMASIGGALTYTPVIRGSEFALTVPVLNAPEAPAAS